MNIEEVIKTIEKLNSDLLDYKNSNYELKKSLDESNEAIKFLHKKDEGRVRESVALQHENVTMKRKFYFDSLEDKSYIKQLISEVLTLENKNTSLEMHIRCLEGKEKDDLDSSN